MADETEKKPEFALIKKEKKQETPQVKVAPKKIVVIKRKTTAASATKDMP